MEQPRTLVIQHSPRDLPGIVEDLPLDITVHRADRRPQLPSLDSYAALILMGGPQMAYRDDNFAWRQDEFALVRQAIARNMPVLSICLGAQVVVEACGGRGFTMDEPEVGWYPVELSPAGRDDRLFDGCPTVFHPKHKHWSTYELPPGAVCLASSEACPEQAFRIGDNVWGLQFHIERRVPPLGEVLPDGDGNPMPELDEEARAGFAALEGTRRRILSNFAQIVLDS